MLRGSGSEGGPPLKVQAICRLSYCVSPKSASGNGRGGGVLTGLITGVSTKQFMYRTKIIAIHSTQIPFNYPNLV